MDGPKNPADRVVGDWTKCDHCISWLVPRLPYRRDDGGWVVDAGGEMVDHRGQWHERATPAEVAGQAYVALVRGVEHEHVAHTTRDR